MAMVLSIRVELGLLRAIVTGEFSTEEAERTLLEVIDALEPNKIERVLVDGRGVTGEPNMFQRFLYGEFAASAVARYVREHRVAHEPQFAYVLQEPVLDPGRFGETVAVNRGMWVKVFDNFEEALSWLEQAGDGLA